MKYPLSIRCGYKNRHPLWHCIFCTNWKSRCAESFVKGELAEYLFSDCPRDELRRHLLSHHGFTEQELPGLMPLFKPHSNFRMWKLYEQETLLFFTYKIAPNLFTTHYFQGYNLSSHNNTPQIISIITHGIVVYPARLPKKGEKGGLGTNELR